MACFVFLGMAFSFIKLMSFSDTLTKREAVILKICPPAIITSAEAAGLKHRSQVRSGCRPGHRSGQVAGQVRLQVRSGQIAGQVTGQIRSIGRIFFCQGN